jgi:hypothetical protein
MALDTNSFCKDFDSFNTVPSRMSGSATSSHLYGSFDYFKGVTTTFTVPPALYITMGATGYSKFFYLNRFYLVQENQYAGVINKIASDMTAAESCITMDVATATVNPLPSHIIFTQLPAVRPIATIMST